MNEAEFQREHDIAAAWAKAEDRVKQLELQNSELKRLASEDQAEIRRIERKADGLKKELDYAMAAGDIQNKELEETKRLISALKALLWRARDAVTDHDFPKGHRYDLLCEEIEKAMGPMRKRECGCGKPSCQRCGDVTEKRKCVPGCMDRHFCNAPKLHEGGCHCKLDE